MESSKRKLQLCFKIHTNQRFEQKKYDFTKLQESEPGQFQDSSLEVLGQKAIRM
jgi:hypothetical protein